MLLALWITTISHAKKPRVLDGAPRGNKQYSQHRGHRHHNSLRPRGPSQFLTSPATIQGSSSPDPIHPVSLNYPNISSFSSLLADHHLYTSAARTRSSASRTLATPLLPRDSRLAPLPQSPLYGVPWPLRVQLRSAGDQRCRTHSIPAQHTQQLVIARVLRTSSTTTPKQPTTTPPAPFASTSQPPANTACYQR